MKKVLLFLTLAIVMLAGSCTVSYEDCEIDNKERKTNVALINNVVDSCAILAQDSYGNIIILKEDSNGELLASYKLQPAMEYHFYIHVGWFMLMLLCTFILVLLITFAITDLIN